MVSSGIIATTTWQVLMKGGATFASKLRWWRLHRGLSQLALAGRADISQRHLSFIELGRASPSREMVVRLATALDVPMRQQNALMLAAGFAPIWRETALVAPELGQVTRALGYILAQQEPFPAVVVDRHWNLLKSNTGAVRLVEFLVGPLAPNAAVNLADALVAPDVLRPFLVNWADVIRYFIGSVEADAWADGTPETATLLERLLAYEGVQPALRHPPAGPTAGPVLPMYFRKDDISLRLFTTIATLGTPQDITLQELRIESFFPMDEETADILRGWAFAGKARRPRKAVPRPG
jgi:transcriptional regulator with XRE-family HTH domain